MAKRTMNQGLAELLDRLEERADENVPSIVISGRAVSKSKENVHLATASGLVAIPLSEIESVTPRGDDPRRVFVSVRNGDRIRSLVPVSSIYRPFGDVRDPIFGDPIGYPTDPNTGATLVCYDTTTGRGSEAATSDDEICRSIDSTA